MEDLKRLVITGGPCGGKTTALAFLSQKLQEAGYTPIMVPEAATLLMGQGIKPDKVGRLPFQELVIVCSRSNEDIAEAGARHIAERKLPQPIVVCDRGIMDGGAYVPLLDFEALLTRKFGPVSPRDHRYDAVFHLRTAADGAEPFYTLETNKERTETPEEARTLDEKTVRAWTGHPHLRILDNSTDFDGKKRRLWEHVCSTLGIPVPIERERKFQVERFDVSKITDTYQQIDIEQAYLMSSDSRKEIRIRRRGQNGVYTYYRTVKRTVLPGERAETERRISKEEYEVSMQFRLRDRNVIRKQRTCFVYKNQYFECDRFENGLRWDMLEIELTTLQSEVVLPPEIKVVDEVTGKPEYSNFHLAEIFQPA